VSGANALGDLERKVLHLLKQANKPLLSNEIQAQLGVSIYELAQALFTLYKEGKIRRVYTDAYDPARPFETIAWSAANKEISQREWPMELTPVVSVPSSFWDMRSKLLGSYEVIDLFDAYSHVIEVAEHELKIACPFIDSYGLFPIINKLRRSPNLRVRIITELDKSEELTFIIDRMKKMNVQVADSALFKHVGEGRSVKVAGSHLKMVIADQKAALVGTFNFSRYHYMVNFDIGFLITNSTIVRFLSHVFDSIWEVSRRIF